MASRKRIGLNYTYNENWIGGTYYIENLIYALNTLPDAQKPHIVIITNSTKDQKIAKKKIQYPYSSFQLGSGEQNKVFQFINKITGKFLKTNFFNQKIQKLDAVFPYYRSTQQSLAKKKIYWIADFQEHYTPNFFSKEAIESRKMAQLEVVNSNENLVLSSNDAYENLKEIYPSHSVAVSILPFAVTHPKFEHLNIDSLLNKYQIQKKYFICPNQFWKHKNQIVILQAVLELKMRGKLINIVFTGNSSDYRNPGYYGELQEFINENDLKQELKFLGFIDRAEQLKLIQNSISVIQPSLFEGWSTVVEDAKSLNKNLIVSDIKVHREQLINSNAEFFDPTNKFALADLLMKLSFENFSTPLYEQHDYKEKIKDFGSLFLKIIN